LGYFWDQMRLSFVNRHSTLYPCASRRFIVAVACNPKLRESNASRAQVQARAVAPSQAERHRRSCRRTDAVAKDAGRHQPGAARGGAGPDLPAGSEIRARNE